FRERFLRESRVAAMLEHPSVVPVLDAGEHEGLIYIAMEWVDGVDLRALLRREGALEPARAVALVEDVGAGLDGGTCLRPGPSRRQAGEHPASGRGCATSGSRIASTARWRGPPRAMGASGLWTSSGPRMRNSSCM